MRVTSKGQVTIPIAIRKQLDIGPESEVEFIVEGNVVRIHRVPSENGRARRILDRLHAAPYEGPSTDALMALTRGDE